MTSFTEVAGRDPSSARYRVLSALRSSPGSGRAQLARLTRLAPSTVTAVVQGLLTEQVVVEGETSLTAAGRPGPKSRGLSLSPSLGSVVGIDFGFRTVRVFFADLSGRRLGFDQASLAEGYDSVSGLSIARELIARVLTRESLSSPLVAGVALPGPIDTAQQRVVSTSILPGWAGCTSRVMAEGLGMPVVLENDANLAALGEHVFGAGRGVANSLTVKFHSGIGAGLVVNDTLVSGARGGAGEIGHIEIDPRGPLCRCGKRGCLDTFVAVPAVLAALLPQHRLTSVSELMALLETGDTGVERVVRDSAATVGAVVAAACLLIAPDRVIVVGSMARAHAAVLDPIREELKRHMVPDAHAVPPVVQGQLGDAHTALGAVALSLRALGWLD